ncbi:MAG: lmo0937 family membrane protein [Desulfobacteraceae bacterium]|nr:MAG: lmo0937 family membrane protein [Desulfobacteraceae bacterium]
MIWTVLVFLLILWLLGLITGYTLGGVIHILLVVAVIVLLFRLFQKRKL